MKKEEIKKQTKIINQRLQYHFKKTDGSFNIPDKMPFMKEFLNDIDKLCRLIKEPEEKNSELIKDIEDSINEYKDDIKIHEKNCNNTLSLYAVDIVEFLQSILLKLKETE